MDFLRLFLVFFIAAVLNCIPNGQSPRDVCKEGDFYNTGKHKERDMICSLAASSGARAEQRSDAIGQNNAILLCLYAVQATKKCDKRNNFKTGIDTW